MIPEETIGTMSVLNIQDGDTEFNFNSDDPKEVERAKQCIQDMLKMGYMIFVKVDDKLKRVKRFNAKTCQYIIGDKETKSATDTTNKKNNKRNTRAIDAKKHKATSVPRSAGG